VSCGIFSTIHEYVLIYILTHSLSRIGKHSQCLLQVTISLRNLLIICMCFINLHCKFIVMPLNFIIFCMIHLNITLKGHLLMIKITITFWRNIWRTHSVLNLTIMMTIIKKKSIAIFICTTTIITVIFHTYYVLPPHSYKKMKQTNWAKFMTSHKKYN